MTGHDEDDQRRVLTLAYRRAELTLEDLWLRYFGLGGTASPMEVDGHLHGLMSLPPMQRDVLAHAINERLDELAHPARVPYCRPPRQAMPASAPLTALVALLEGTHLAPPGRLTTAAEAAGRALGVRLVIYLVDYDQDRLVPVPGPDTVARPSLGVDTTVAGRAFRQVETIPVPSAEQPRLWVPLLDGAERLGVLDVLLPDATDLYDPGLRQQCRWLSALIGHLVVATTQYGDSLDAVRRRQRRSPAAELIWQLLPPLTAGTDRFVLAGLLEPAYGVGGDAFDYDLSETTAALAIFDAAGHDLTAGLMTAAALAAYRSARGDGQGLYSQARAIDETITRQFHTHGFVTGILAEVDLPTGRLRYVAAGHPYPLLLRSGKIVKSLTDGRRLPFGLGTAELSVGEEILQPDDWLVLHSDGITEARGSSGETFGEARLVDFLEREASTGHPPPETVRRLIHAVLAHQHGRLQDDATVLLARWTSPNDLEP